MSIDTQTAAEIVANAEASAALPRSVVARKYKLGYAERAIAARGKKGVDRRVIADSCGDWLALEIAALIRPTKKHTTDIPLFEAICAANGVDTSKLPRDTKGWQGRLRMNGAQMLRTAVAEADGELKLPDGSAIKAPRAWVERHTGK